MSQTLDLTDDNVYAVERIEKSRTLYGGKVEYLIKWEGYPSSENSWEPAENIVDRSVIKDFLKEEAKKKHGEGFDKAEEEKANKKRKMEVHKNLQKLAALKKAKELREREMMRDRKNYSQKPTVDSNKSYRKDHNKLLAPFDMVKSSKKSSPAHLESEARHGSTALLPALPPPLVNAAGAHRESHTIALKQDLHSNKSYLRDNLNTGKKIGALKIPSLHLLPHEQPEDLPGFAKGYKVEKVLGIVWDRLLGPKFLVKWKDVYEGSEPILELVPREILNLEEPQMVIAYYESIIIFRHLSEELRSEQ